MRNDNEKVSDFAQILKYGVLSLSYLKVDWDKLFEFLKGNKDVLKLVLYGTDMGDAELLMLQEILSDANAVTKLYIGKNVFSSLALCRFLDSLHNKNIAVLDLSSLNLADDMSIAVAIAGIKSLKKVDFSGATINAEFMDKLCDSLPEMSKLRRMGLSASVTSVEQISSVLRRSRTHSHIKVLDFSGSNVYSKVTYKLASFLSRNKHSIKKLKMCNIMGDGPNNWDLIHLADKGKLKSLNISYNEIFSLCKILAHSLVTSSLTVLNIEHCTLGNRGAELMAVALMKNDALKFLYIGSNDIKEEGAKRLVDMLKVNKGLLMLNMWGNPIEQEGFLAFAGILKEYHRLVALNIGKTYTPTADDVQQLRDSMTVNKVILSVVLNSKNDEIQMLEHRNLMAFYAQEAKPLEPFIRQWDYLKLSKNNGHNEKKKASCTATYLLLGCSATSPSYIQRLPTELVTGYILSCIRFKRQEEGDGKSQFICKSSTRK